MGPILSFLKSLFSPSMQRETVIEHLIETLARKADPCEWVQVLQYEQLQEYMAKKSAKLVLSGGPYPNESVVHQVRVGPNDYDVRVSRATGSRGVLITSKLAGTDDYAEILEAQAEAANEREYEDDAVLMAIDIGVMKERPVTVPPLSVRAIREFFEKNSMTMAPMWEYNQSAVYGGAICNMPSHGTGLLMVGQTPTAAYLLVNLLPMELATPEDVAEGREAIAAMMPRWSEALIKMSSEAVEFDNLSLD